MTDFKNEYLNYKEIYLKLKYKNQIGGNIESKSLIPNWIKDCTLIDPSLDTLTTFLDKIDSDLVIEEQPPVQSQEQQPIAPPPSPLLEPVIGSLTNDNIKKAIKDYHTEGTYLDTKERFGELSLWDVSQVTNMAYIFFGISIFEDISNWDVSNVEDMSYMFYSSKFDENINLNKWDDKIKKVRNFEGMFSYSTFSNGGEDFKWNINDDVNVRRMFFKSTIEKNKIKIFGLSQENFEKMFIL